MIGIFPTEKKNYVFDCQSALYFRYNYLNLLKVTQTRFLVIFEKKTFCDKMIVLYTEKIACSS